MRLFGILVSLVVLLAAIGYGGAEIYTFNAYPLGDQCQLEWNSGVETNVASFVIERSAESMMFIPIGHLDANGSYSRYTFTDTSPLTAEMQRVFYYRLKIVDQDGNTQYSETREVSLSFNTVQQTWGSIKAMFR